MKVIIPAVICVSLMVGCAQLDQFVAATAPPEVQQQLAAYEAELADKAAQLEGLETAFAEQSVKLKELAEAGEVAEAKQVMAHLEALQLQYKSTADEYAAVAASERQLMEAQVSDTTQGLLGAIDPFVPAPLQPLVPAASSLVVMAMSRRSRKHTVKALKQVAIGNLGEGVKGVMRAVGAQHSSEDPKEIIGGAVKAARKGGATPETLAKLEQAQKELES